MAHRYSSSAPCIVFRHAGQSFLSLMQSPSQQLCEPLCRSRMLSYLRKMRTAANATATTSSWPRSRCTNTPTARWPSSTDPDAWPVTGPAASPATPQSGRPREPLRRDPPQACGEVDSRSAPDHFPTGPTTSTEAVNSECARHLLLRECGPFYAHPTHPGFMRAPGVGNPPSS